MNEANDVLPIGWEWSILSDVVSSITYGHTASASRESVGPRFLRITDIQDGHVNWETVPYCKCDDVDKYNLKTGDIVIARTGATTGKNFLIGDLPGPSVFASYLIRLETLDDLQADYLSKFMHSAHYWQQITSVSKGSAQPGANASILSEIAVPVAPLAEQRRIVAKIEALQERSRKAREALAEVGPLLEQFRQSLLAAAFRGDLTADWRAANPNVEPASELLNRIRQERRQKWEQSELAKYEAKGKQPPKDWQEKYKAPEPVDDSDLPELPVGWCWTSFDECDSEITVGFVGPMKHRYVSEGLTMLRSQNVRPLKFTKANCEFIPADFDAELAKSRLYGGEVLVVRSSVNVGDCCVYPKDEGIANCSDLVITRPLDNINASYAAMYIVSPVGRAVLRLQRMGNAQPHFNVGSMKKSVLPLAPFAEQSKIVQILNNGIATVGELTETASTIFELTQLDQSILAKAFRGELVPQDPNDEPASVLLERIRDARQSAAPTKSSKRKDAANGRK